MRKGLKTSLWATVYLVCVDVNVKHQCFSTPPTAPTQHISLSLMIFSPYICSYYLLFCHKSVRQFVPSIFSISSNKYQSIGAIQPNKSEVNCLKNL